MADSFTVSDFNSLRGRVRRDGLAEFDENKLREEFRYLDPKRRNRNRTGSIRRGKLFIPIYWRDVLDMNDAASIRFTVYYDPDKRIFLLEEAKWRRGERGRLTLQRITGAGGWLQIKGSLKRAGLDQDMNTIVGVYGAMTTDDRRVLLVNIPDNPNLPEVEQQHIQGRWCFEVEEVIQSIRPRTRSMVEIHG